MELFETSPELLCHQTVKAICEGERQFEYKQLSPEVRKERDNMDKKDRETARTIERILQRIPKLVKKAAAEGKNFVAVHVIYPLDCNGDPGLMMPWGIEEKIPVPANIKGGVLGLYLHLIKAGLSPSIRGYTIFVNW